MVGQEKEKHQNLWYLYAIIKWIQILNIIMLKTRKKNLITFLLNMKAK